MNTTDITNEDAMAEVPWTAAVLPGEIPNVDYTGVQADLLSTLFAGQALLMQKYRDIELRNGCVVVDPPDWGDIDARHVQMRLKDLMQRTVEELGEACNCLKNKPWKNTFVPTDEAHFVEECADALHFFIEFCITAGITPEDLFLTYFKKHTINTFRHRSNY